MRTGTAIAFHFVTCPPRSRPVAPSRQSHGKPALSGIRSHSPLAERKDGCPSRVNRGRSSHEAEAAQDSQEVFRSLTRPARRGARMHVPEALTSVTIATRRFQ